MNRQQRRQQEKERRRRNKGVLVSDVSSDSYEWKATWRDYKEPKKEIEPKVPGINCPPVLAYFNQMVEMNMWHKREELDEVIETIKRLSTEDNDEWSWAYNFDCKYVDIRFDMRDGAFTLRNKNGDRMCLEQLKWQYKSLKESNKKDNDERPVSTSV